MAHIPLGLSDVYAMAILQGAYSPTPVTLARSVWSPGVTARGERS
jgi:hypothetical protein